jgi:hypothetical protein
MSQDLSPDDRRAIKESSFVGDNGNLALHIGYFILWFGTCEGIITQLLARVLGFSNQVQRLEFVTRGLDAKAKIERLRQAAKLLMPLGSNLDNRLLHFQKKMVPLRNRIVHTWMILEVGPVHFTSLGKIHGVTFIHDQNIPSEPENIPLDDLFSHAAWIHAFSVDLLDAMESSLQSGVLEVDQPRSHLPKAHPRDQPAKARRAKTGKRAQKPR